MRRWKHKNVFAFSEYVKAFFYFAFTFKELTEETTLQCLMLMRIFTSKNHTTGKTLSLHYEHRNPNT